MRIFLAAHIVNCIISDPVPPPPRARAIQWKISAALSSHRRVHTKCTNIRIFSLMRECTRERTPLRALPAVCLCLASARARAFFPHQQQTSLPLHTSLAAFIQALSISLSSFPGTKVSANEAKHTHKQVPHSYLVKGRRGCSANIFQMNL